MLLESLGSSFIGVVFAETCLPQNTLKKSRDSVNTD